jgi:hypothetical protein
MNVDVALAEVPPVDDLLLLCILAAKDKIAVRGDEVDEFFEPLLLSYRSQNVLLLLQTLLQIRCNFLLMAL